MVGFGVVGGVVGLRVGGLVKGPPQSITWLILGSPGVANNGFCSHSKSM